MTQHFHDDPYQSIFRQRYEATGCCVAMFWCFSTLQGYEASQRQQILQNNKDPCATFKVLPPNIISYMLVHYTQPKNEIRKDPAELSRVCGVCQVVTRYC